MWALDNALQQCTGLSLIEVIPVGPLAICTHPVGHRSREYSAATKATSRKESQRWSRHVPKRRSTSRMPEA